MRIYLANAKQNYATEALGFVRAQRDCDYADSLYSFHYIMEAGRLDLPIRNEDLHGGEHKQVVDEYRVRTRTPRRKRR